VAVIKLHANLHVTPEQYRAALTDFGPGRSKVFPNSADDDLVVLDRGDDYADVTEGSRGVWETLHYDWSDPDHIVLTTTDSNAWGRNSSHTYDFTRLADGTTDLDYTIVREGKNARGYVLQVVLGTIAKGFLVRGFRTSVAAIEASASTE
jgi:hypothetical protein